MKDQVTKTERQAILYPFRTFCEFLLELIKFGALGVFIGLAIVAILT